MAMLVRQDNKKTRVKRGFSVTPRGLEQLADLAGKAGVSGEGGTESGTVAGDSATIRQISDPDLRLLLAAWPSLYASVRSAILALIPSAGKEGL